MEKNQSFYDDAANLKNTNRSLAAVIEKRTRDLTVYTQRSKGLFNLCANIDNNNILRNQDGNIIIMVLYKSIGGDVTSMRPYVLNYNQAVETVEMFEKVHFPFFCAAFYFSVVS